MTLSFHLPRSNISTRSPHDKYKYIQMWVQIYTNVKRDTVSFVVAIGAQVMLRHDNRIPRAVFAWLIHRPYKLLQFLRF